MFVLGVVLMRVGTFIKGVCAMMSIVTVFSLGLQCVYGETLTNDFIEQSEASKAQAEQDKQALSSGLSNIKAILSSLESAKGNLEAYITELDSDLATINDNQEKLKQQITAKEAEIATTQAALDEAEEVAARQYDAMKRRIKHMYEKGNRSYMELFLTSTGFSDMLNKMEYVQRLSKYDRDMLTAYIDTKNEIAATKEKLESEQKELEANQTALQNEENAMETLIASKEGEISAYDADIDNKEAAVAAYQAEIAAQDAVIKELEAAIQAEKKRLLEENRKAIVYDGGQFAWPAPSYSRISDDYGNRIHPTLGVQQFHNGIDMAAPGGSPILAAYDGEVVAAAYSSTMGNYIMIDHGDGLVTIYMHASSLGVSKGQTVVRGEQIGCVGSTGRSTGNHLHFSVRVNGSYTSPWSYLK